MLLEVALEVPAKIALGLASGQLERVGSVVRDATTKQIVMWLLEGGQIASNSNLAGGLLNTVLQASSGGIISAIAGVANLAVGAANIAVTARSHYLIMQQLQGLTNLVTIVGGIGVLNLAATAVSTIVLLDRLSSLEKVINDLDAKIAKQFAQVRHVKLQAAIQSAKYALGMNSPEDRKLHAHLALGKLFEAREHIWLEIDVLKGSSRFAENNELMQKNVLQAMQLDALHSRCLLEISAVTQAKDYLDSKLEDYRETSRLLVHRHLGTHRAAYFHNSVLEGDLLRYIAIEHWLEPDANRLLHILLANRRDFWNKDVADGSKIHKPGKDRYIDALTQSELLIENYHRFQGMHAEIEAIERLGISHTEWEKQQEEALAKAEINLAEYNDYVALVDSEAISQIEAA